MLARRLAIAVAATTALGAAIAPASALTQHATTLGCTGDPSKLQTVRYTVDGQPTYAIYAVPRGRPKGIVVFDHGYQNTPYAWQGHVLATASHDGVIAVAVHYHGETDAIVTDSDGSISPKSGSRGWRVQEGADDTVAAAKMFMSTCRLIGAPAIVFGISMGGNTSGLAVEEDATRTNGKPLFNYWFDVEGVTNVIETYAEARAVAASGSAYTSQAQADIEQEMGGKPLEQAPDVYVAHTVNARPSDLAASGLRGVVIVHGIADGTVPHDQSRETEAILRGAHIPTEFYAVGTKQAGTESGTTADTDVTGGDSPLFAGHGWEGSNTQTVIVTAFQRLDALFGGAAPADKECFVAGDPTGTVTTGVASTC